MTLAILNHVFNLPLLAYIVLADPHYSLPSTSFNPNPSNGFDLLTPGFEPSLNSPADPLPPTHFDIIPSTTVSFIADPLFNNLSSVDYHANFPTWSVSIRDHSPKSVSIFWKVDGRPRLDEGSEVEGKPKEGGPQQDVRPEVADGDGSEYFFWYWPDDTEGEYNIRAVLTDYDSIYVYNLTAGQLYNFGLTAVSGEYRGDYVTFQHRTAPELNVTQVHIVGLTSDSMTVRIDPSEAVVDFYQLSLRGDSKSFEHKLIPQRTASSDEWTFTTLMAGAGYTLTAVAHSGNVTSQPVQLFNYTRRNPLSDIECQIDDNTTLSLESRSAGMDEKYRISCTRTDIAPEEDCARNCTEIEMPGQTLFQCQSLEMGVNYTFNVVSVIKTGGESDPAKIICETGIKKPERVSIKMPVVDDDNTVLLEWSDPWKRMGPITEYVIRIYTNPDKTLLRPQSKTSKRRQNFGYEHNLRAGHTYTFEIAAVTSAGEGDNVSVNVEVPIRAPHKIDLKEPGIGRKTNKIMVTFTNPFTNRYGDVTTYCVLMEKRNYPRQNCYESRQKYRSKLKISPCGTKREHGDHCWGIGSDLNKEPEFFTLGDHEGSCDGHAGIPCNEKLSSNTSYCIFVRAYTTPTQTCDNMTATALYTDVALLQEPVTTEEEKEHGTLIALGVIMTLLCVTILLLLIFRKRLLAYLIARSDTRPQSSIRRGDVPMRPMPVATSKPIRIAEFIKSVMLMEKDSGLQFTEEYEDLKTVGRDQSCEQSQLQSNRAKNRFTNVLPYDVTRVKLLPTEDEEGSDYINASWMPGFQSRREYIATQGPLPSTKDDFWRMIWEYNCRAVIMLTLCVERNRIKCDQYWPLDYEPAFYGDLQVVILNETKCEAWHIRELEITMGGETRRLKHFHYVEWPDMYVPEKRTLVSFVRLVRDKVNQITGGPIVVHCSAGVGRSGTFIALDTILQQIESKKESIDVYGIVFSLRMNRHLMVQTEQQYIFIYQCTKFVLQQAAGLAVDENEDDDDDDDEDSDSSTESRAADRSTVSLEDVKSDDSHPYTSLEGKDAQGSDEGPYTSLGAHDEEQEQAKNTKEEQNTNVHTEENETAEDEGIDDE